MASYRDVVSHVGGAPGGTRGGGWQRASRPLSATRASAGAGAHHGGQQHHNLLWRHGGPVTAVPRPRSALTRPGRHQAGDRSLKRTTSTEGVALVVRAGGVEPGPKRLGSESNLTHTLAAIKRQIDEEKRRLLSGATGKSGGETHVAGAHHYAGGGFHGNVGTSSGSKTAAGGSAPTTRPPGPPQQGGHLHQNERREWVPTPVAGGPNERREWVPTATGGTMSGSGAGVGARPQSATLAGHPYPTQRQNSAASLRKHGGAHLVTPPASKHTYGAGPTTGAPAPASGTGRTSAHERFYGTTNRPQSPSSFLARAPFKGGPRDYKRQRPQSAHPGVGSGAALDRLRRELSDRRARGGGVGGGNAGGGSSGSGTGPASGGGGSGASGGGLLDTKPRPVTARVGGRKTGYLPNTAVGAGGVEKRIESLAKGGYYTPAKVIGQGAYAVRYTPAKVIGQGAESFGSRFKLNVEIRQLSALCSATRTRQTHLTSWGNAVLTQLEPDQWNHTLIITRSSPHPRGRTTSLPKRHSINPRHQQKS